jgi:hypothetical protein
VNERLELQIPPPSRQLTGIRKFLLNIDALACFCFLSYVNGIARYRGCADFGSEFLKWASRQARGQRMARMLLEPKFNVKIQKESGSAPLYLASFRGYVEVARVPPKHGADHLNLTPFVHWHYFWHYEVRFWKPPSPLLDVMQLRQPRARTVSCDSPEQGR